MIQHKYELYVGRVIGVHEDYMELIFYLKCRSYMQVYVNTLEFFKENISSTFSNLRFLREVQYVQYNDYAL